MQLQREVSRCGQLEQTNRELKDQVAQKSYSHSSDQLERSKRQLEEEVSDLRRRMETAQMEQGQAEQFRRDVEEKARQEIQRKLDQVNLFLQVQRNNTLWRRCSGLNSGCTVTNTSICIRSDTSFKYLFLKCICDPMT